MLKFRQILNFPSFFSNRIKSLKEITTKIKDIKSDNISNILIIGSSSKYTVQIKLLERKIELDTPVKVSCTCDSFKYEFEYVLFKNKGLIEENHPEANFILAPKKSNPNNVISGCKHIISLANLINNHREKILRKI